MEIHRIKLVVKPEFSSLLNHKLYNMQLKLISHFLKKHFIDLKIKRLMKDVSPSIRILLDFKCQTNKLLSLAATRRLCSKRDFLNMYILYFLEA